MGTLWWGWPIKSVAKYKKVVQVEAPLERDNWANHLVIRRVNCRVNVHQLALYIYSLALLVRKD